MTTIQLRRDTATNWASKNPVLAAGEMGIETDTNKFKFGDGTVTWNNLPYVSTGGGGGTTTDITASLPLLLTDGNLTLKLDSTNLAINGNGELTVNLDELGNEVNDLSGRVTANEADIVTIQTELTDLTGNVENKQDKFTPVTPLVLNQEALPTVLRDIPFGSTKTYTFNLNTLDFSDNADLFWMYNSGAGNVGIGYHKSENQVWINNLNYRAFYNQISLGEETAATIILELSGENNSDGIACIFMEGLVYNSKGVLLGEQKTMMGDYNNNGGTAIHFVDGWSTPTNLSLNYDDTLVLKDNKLSVIQQEIPEQLSAGTGINITDNSININQGTSGLSGLTINTTDTSGGTVTYSDDGSVITFDKGAYGYVVLPNKGTNNNYEIVVYANYLGEHSTRTDCKILGIAGTANNNQIVDWDNKLGCLYVDTWGSLYSFVRINNGSTSDTRASTSTIDIVKYVINSTSATVYTGTSLDSLTEITTIDLASTGYIVFFVGNSIFSTDNTDGNSWVKASITTSSYILDKTTNTYLMKNGTISNDVAIATDVKYGLVLPDNNTITVNDGVISANIPEVDTSKLVTTDTAQTISGVKTFSETIVGNISGTANKAKNDAAGLPIESTYIKKINAVDLASEQTITGNKTFTGYVINQKQKLPINLFKGDDTEQYGRLTFNNTGNCLQFNSVLGGINLQTNTADDKIYKINSTATSTKYQVYTEEDKSVLSSISLPSDKYIDLTLGADMTPYTAPADGWFFVNATTSEQGMIGFQGSETDANKSTYSWAATSNGVSTYLPVKKGESTILRAINITKGTLKFYYAVGSEPEE